LGNKALYFFLSLVDILQAADAEGVMTAQAGSKLVRNG
jgi:hypothetical protein